MRDISERAKECPDCHAPIGNDGKCLCHPVGVYKLLGERRSTKGAR